MNYLIPFLILITIVVFIHEYEHYYFAKKLWSRYYRFFNRFLERKLLVGTINLELDGKFVGFL